MRSTAKMRRAPRGCRIVLVLTKGKLIVLNGASSAGKSTLCRAAREALDTPFLWFPLDIFLDGDLLPRRLDGAFAWSAQRERVFAGHLACLRALAEAGNNVLTDIVFESGEQFAEWRRTLVGLDVFLVGVHLPLHELERRERERGDRRLGDAKRDLDFVHSFCAYDLEVDSSLSPEDNACRIAAAWRSRPRL